MAFIVPSEEPEEFTAGDRVQWTRTFGDYPVSEGWTLTYYFRSSMAGGIKDVVASTSGTDYSVDISPESSSEWPPGTYYFQAVVTKSGDRKLVASGKVLVNPNFASVEVPTDIRSRARIGLDAINAVLQGRATHDQQRYVIQATGRSVDKVPMRDLLALRDDFQMQVKAEESKANGGRGKNIHIRFNR